MSLFSEESAGFDSYYSRLKSVSRKAPAPPDRSYPAFADTGVNQPSEERKSFEKGPALLDSTNEVTHHQQKSSSKFQNVRSIL